MTRIKPAIAEQLAAAGLVIENSLSDAEIVGLAAAFGYSAGKLGEGTALLRAARAAVSAQKKAADRQMAASQALAEAKTRAVDAYQTLAKVARASCSPSQLALLGLGGAMPRSTADFLTAALTLFDNAVAVEPLIVYGYSAEKLTTERWKIEDYIAADQVHEAAKSAAQQATRKQNAALDVLNKWTTQYIEIARVALREKPQLPHLAAKLGIPVCVAN